MDNQVHNQIVSFIWGIADDCLRDVYVRGKYRDVILPMTVIRRLDAMLEETKPSTMEELIRISGLSHGTDVWLGNAQDIIRAGIAPLADCICCRDDIMNALMDYGVEPKMAFPTMEAVRKGKGLTPEMEDIMRKNRVPDWFID